MNRARIILPEVLRRCPINMLTNGNAARLPSTLLNACIIAFRDIMSCAFMPSTDKIGALVFNSVSVCNTCEMHSLQSLPWHVETESCLLHCVHQLLKHCSRNQSANDVLRHNFSNSPICFTQHCQTTHANCRISSGTQPKVFRIVEQRLEVFHCHP